MANPAYSAPRAEHEGAAGLWIAGVILYYIIFCCLTMTSLHFSFLQSVQKHILLLWMTKNVFTNHLWLHFCMYAGSLKMWVYESALETPNNFCCSRNWCRCSLGSEKLTQCWGASFKSKSDVYTAELFHCLSKHFAFDFIRFISC